MPYDKPEEIVDDFKAGVRRNAQKMWDDSPLKGGIDKLKKANDWVGRQGEEAFDYVKKKLTPSEPELKPPTKPAPPTKPPTKPVDFVGPEEAKPMTRERGVQRMRATRQLQQSDRGLRGGRR